MAQRKFAQCLGEFHFEYIGDAKTDDEKCIGKCVEFFSELTAGFVANASTHTSNVCLQLFLYQQIRKRCAPLPVIP